MPYALGFCFDWGVWGRKVMKFAMLIILSIMIITILAIFILSEKVGIRRWLAILVGFIGVYIVLNPDFENFNYMKLAPIACAFCYAISMTITKITSDFLAIYH